MNEDHPILPGEALERFTKRAGQVAGAVEAAREDGRSSALLPPAELLSEIDEVRTLKAAAIWAGHFEEAVQERDRERSLVGQACGDDP